MSIPQITEPSQGAIPELVLGSGPSARTVGGGDALPACFVDGSPGREPAIALEIGDVPPAPVPPSLAALYGAALDDPMAWLEKGMELCRPDLVTLRLGGSHPEIGRTPGQSAKLVAKVLAAAKVPLVILGSGHPTGDVELFKEVAELLPGTGCLIGKAQERNYRSMAAIASAASLPLIALSDLDVNLCKQLNILLTQAGFPRDRIVIDPMASALGYGLEYTYSVMERIRLAALRQGDEVLRCPLLLDLGEVVGKAKEVHATIQAAPGWGDPVRRGAIWEAVTGAAFLLSGADILSVRNPDALAALQAHRDALWRV